MPSLHEGHGKLAIVGIGPGSYDHLTRRAEEVIRASDIVIGNASYLGSIRHLLEGKEVIESSMGEEVARARKAVELARQYVVSIVSGGDPGVYGMAGIVLEVAVREGGDVPVEVVPGVTAATAAASRLGSPLTGDFAVVSLSDLLTPKEVIERRLRGALSMGVPVVLYNPRSRGRPHNLAEAVAITQEFRSDTTPVGVVTDAYRENEEVIVTTLGRFIEWEGRVTMHSTVIIGGEESRIDRTEANGEEIITPRGYHRKYLY
ncbi:MAG: precorrin-3B C(17)-methyltransferase [Methanomicrobiales archaeon]|nr:precorrin-3B C(17)-methyltransferase [Methanomicrobiales archaeon]